jgi:hypothetical protein
MSRYRIEGPWERVSEEKVVDFYGERSWFVVIERTGLTDTRGGHYYADGAYRVSVTGPSPKPRTKTFKGEMAWSQAQNYADDCLRQIAMDKSWLGVGS